MIDRTGRLAAILVAGAIGAGCGAGGGEWTGAVRDSAGVTIVENPAAGTWTASDRWRVEEDLRIGVMSGEDVYQFGEIADVAPLSDGRIVVRDRQAQTLRVYDANGRYVRTIGGPGSGPGEFSSSMEGSQEGVVVMPDDAIVAPDLMLQRVSRFSPDGELLGSFQLRMEDGMAIRWEATADGQLVQQSYPVPIPGMAEDLTNQLLLRESDGTIVSTLAELPRGETMDMSGGAPTMRIFSAEPVWTVDPAGRRLVTAVNNAYRLEVRDLDHPDRIVQLIRLAQAPRPVSESDQNRWRELMRSMFEDQGVPPEMMSMVEGMIQFADYYPAFADLKAGPDGTIWVQHLQTPADAAELEEFDLQDMGSHRWDVFDGEGRFLGTMEFPRRFRMTRVVGDAVYGVLRDELDVPYAARLRLVRPDAN